MILNNVNALRDITREEKKHEQGTTRTAALNAKKSS